MVMLISMVHGCEAPQSEISPNSQAVQEVAEDIFDFIADKVEYHEQQILRRIAGAGSRRLVPACAGG